MHTSVRLSDALGKEAQQIAKERGISMTSFVQTAIRNEVQRKEISDLEKRLSGSFGTLQRQLDKHADANRAGFALFFALTRELLSHIYQDPQTAEAQLQSILRSAQAQFLGDVKKFFEGKYGD